MITAIGAFFWLITLAAVFRLLHIGQGMTRSRWLELGILLLFACLLLFRPHEDIFGGEDPGSYINSGITYNRQKQLFYIDELLSKVPPETRSSFYYGHSGYGTTKDACLWIRNAGQAKVGPHFQPAYPLMIAFAARIGQESWALFVVPLFTIFTALALRALALQTIPHRWAGLVVFILYIFNPLTVWHGRCARPEIIAGFMFFGGCVLTLQAWQARPWKNMTDLLLGAVCIGAAPLFHVTAWLLIIPTVLAVVIIVVFKGRDDFLPYLAIIGLMMAAFYAQTKYITDYYTVKRFLDLIFLRSQLIAAGFILLTVSALLAKILRRSRSRSEVSPQPFISPLLSLTLGICLIAFLASLIFFRQIYGDLPILGRPIRNYLYLTDFRVVANMLSIPIMLLILAGLIAWLTGRGEKRAYRVVFVMVLFPAVTLTGNIHDFMMTRYLMVAFIPMTALFLTALIVSILPKESGLWNPLILSALLCVIAVNKRSPLITTTEHNGFCRFLRPYAEIIKANKGMLLGEYSRIAAPLEHFFGVPTLGLDNERHDNYEHAEKAWAEIMRSETNRPAYFITPYHIPLSTLFTFEPIYLASFQDCRLEQARRSLPAKVGKSELTLRLFKMQLKQRQPSPRASSDSAEIITLDAGNMGLRHFANVRTEPLSLPAADLQADTSYKLPLPSMIRRNTDLLLFFLSDESTFRPPSVKSSSDKLKLNSDFIQLADKWWLARISGFKDEEPDAIIITPSARLFLAEARALSNGQSVPLKIDPLPLIPRKQWIPARWARAHAQVLLTAPRRSLALLMILLKAPDPEAAGWVTLQLSWKGNHLGPPREIPSEQWQWQIWQLPPSTSASPGDVEWLTLQTDPAWNPGKKNFPEDLGILISQIVCLPDQ